MRKSKLPTLKKATWSVYSKFIRLRDAIKTTGTKEYAKCVTCVAIHPIKEMDAGHFRHNAFDYDERNVHAQCVRCNKYLSGNHVPYTLFMLDTYGREVVEYLANVHDTKILKREDYERLKEEYKLKLEGLDKA